MSFLSSRIAYAPLKENTPYKVTLSAFIEKEATAPTETNLGFVQFKWVITEDGHPINDSRSFPMGTDILASQIIEQTGEGNAQNQEALFQMLVDSKKELTLWVERKVDGVNFYTNYHFREFTSKPVVAGTVQAPLAEVPIN